MHHSKFCGSTSALGQKQTFGPRNPMSALPPKADIRTWPSSLPEQTEGGGLSIIGHGLAITHRQCAGGDRRVAASLSRRRCRGNSRVDVPRIRITSISAVRITSFNMASLHHRRSVLPRMLQNGCEPRHSHSPSRPMKEVNKTGTGSGLAKKLRQLGDVHWPSDAVVGCPDRLGSTVAAHD